MLLVALCMTAVVGGVLNGASASASAAATRIGFLPDGKVAAFQALESYVGHPARYVVQVADTRSISQFEGSVWGEVIDAGQFQTINNRVTFVLSVPLTIGLGFGASTAQRGAALQATANGTHDFPYQLISQYLKQGGFPNAIIRLGWEFDGNWMPWSSVGNEAVWANAYRHIHDVMQAQSPELRFDWNGDPGFMQSETAAYPGDKYVDIVGYDVYDQPGGIPWNSATKTWVDPKAAWNFFLPKLQFQRDFAIAHGKQVSYPEWALSGANAVVPTNVGGDDPTFIQGMYDWMSSLPDSGPGSLAYHSYFNQDTDSNHRINAGWFPNASARFKALFGSTAPVTTVPAPVTTAPAPPTTAPAPPTTQPAPPTTQPAPPTTVPAPVTTVPDPPTTVPAPPTTDPPVTTPPSGQAVIPASSAASNVPTEGLWAGARSARYVCCWGSQGQYVSFSFTSPGGPTDLALRYSAGNGGAHRKVELDGDVWQDNLAFPRTANWNTWSKVSLTRTLASGRHTLKVWFDVPAGSSQWLNLDNLTVGTTQVYAAGSVSSNLPTESRWAGAQNNPYICAWGSQGQYVTFTFTSRGGPTNLALRYSAGNGDATRKIVLDGSVLSANQAFPSTWDWNAWATMSLQPTLSSGSHTLKIWFDGAAGSSQWLNLDNLSVAAG